MKNPFSKREKALKALIKKYEMDLAVDLVLQDWITACIIERKQEGRRKELVEIQQKIKEMEVFIMYLKTQ